MTAAPPAAAPTGSAVDGGDDLVATARALLEPLWNGDDVVGVERRARDLLELARRRGDVDGECAALYVTLAAAAVRGDAETNRVIATMLQRRAAQHGLATWESLGRARLARLHLNDGREDLALDDAVAAELLLDDVPADDPSSGPALNGIASSYLRLGLYEDADRLFHRATEAVVAGSPFVTAALSYNRMLTRCTWAVGLLRSGHPDAAWERVEAAARVVSRTEAERSRLRRELIGLRLFVELLVGPLDRDDAAAQFDDLRRQRGVETDSFALFALAHRAADDGDVEVATRHVDDGLDAVHPLEGAAIQAALRWQRARIAVLAEPDHLGVQEIWEYAQYAAQQVWELRLRREEAVRDRLRIGRLQRDHDRVSQAVDEDPLTGLGNRRRLDRARDALEEASSGGWVCVAYLDIDGFKAVNDEHGHELGDGVLVEVAKLLSEHTRGSDVLGRFGGDEFVVVVRDCPPSSASALAERLLAAVRVHDWHGLQPGLSVSVSIGIATGEVDHDQLFTRADDALYAAKRAGRDRAEVVVLQRPEPVPD